jgi:chromatin segregation and condensation protein Rec8/ScpA/Scc1 (kleisin family)
VEPLRHRVEDTMGELYRRVVSEGLVPLLRHLHSRSDVDEAVVHVVAALELVRLGGICAEQSRPFAEIYLRPGRVALDLERLLQPEATRAT